MANGAPVPGPRRVAGPAALAALGGVLGLLGVAVSAAAAHREGGELGRTAGLFLLLHASALLGLGAFAAAVPARSRPLLAAGFVLAAGAALFCGDLAAAGLAGWRPLPLAAPVGGTLLMAGWALVALGAVLAARRG